MREWLKRRTGFELAILANLLWGTSFLASKQVLVAWGPYTTSVIRLGLALVAFLALAPIFGCRLTRPRTRAEWSSVFAVGVFSFAALYPLQFAGLRYIPSALSAAIMLVAPLVVVALHQLISSERPCLRRYAAVVLGIAGGLLLLFPGQSHASTPALDSSRFWLGVGLTSAAAICLSLSIVAIKRTPGRLGGSSLAIWSAAISFVILFPLAIAEAPVPGTTALHYFSASLWMIYLGVVCTAFCTLLWQRAVTLCSSHHVAPTMHLKTPVAVLLGPMIAGESLSFLVIAGVLIVLLAVCVVQPREARIEAA